MTGTRQFDKDPESAFGSRVENEAPVVRGGDSRDD
jgi:hypothetical protein